MARHLNQTMLTLRQVQTCLGRSWARSAAALVSLVASISPKVSQLRSYPEEVETCESYLAGAALDVKWWSFIRNLRTVNRILFYFGKNVVFLQRSFSRQRITKTGTMRPNSRQQDYQNKPLAKKRWICCTHLTVSLVCFPFHYSSTLFQASRRRQLTHISAHVYLKY